MVVKFTFSFLNLAKLHIYIPKKIDYHHPGLPPQLPYHQEAEEAVASLGRGLLTLTDCHQPALHKYVHGVRF